VGTTAEKVLGTIGGSLWEPWQRRAWYYRGKSVGTMAEKWLGTSAWGEPCGYHWREGVVTSGKIT